MKQVGAEEQYLIKGWDGLLKSHELFMQLIAQCFQQLEAIDIIYQPPSASTTPDEHYVLAMVKHWKVMPDKTNWPYPDVC